MQTTLPHSLPMGYMGMQTTLPHFLPYIHGLWDRLQTPTTLQSTSRYGEWRI